MFSVQSFSRRRDLKILYIQLYMNKVWKLCFHKRFSWNETSKQQTAIDEHCNMEHLQNFPFTFSSNTSFVNYVIII